MSKTLFYMSTLLLSILGCSFSKNWFIMWFWMELQSLALMPMLSSKMSPRSIESTNKYFLFQAAGSAFLLLGMLLRLFFSGKILINGKYKWLEYSLMMFSLCMKMGMFPTHFWFTDVIQGLKLWSGFFMAIPSKIMPLYILMCISKMPSMIVLNLMGMLSVTIGSMFGIHQTQLRKLMALSSMAHLGWMIIMIPKANNWFAAILFISYMIMVTPLFWMGKIYNMEHLLKTKKMSKKTMLSGILLISILSMAGFPPLLGFFYKWLMFFLMVSKSKLLTMAILIMASLLSLYFYIQMCISSYMIFWPLSKTLFSKSHFKMKKSMPTWTIMMTKTTIMYFLMTTSPISSTWKL